MSKRLFSVRLAPDVIAAVRGLARSDGVTVSEWMRRLVARELRAPFLSVDLSRYPRSQTTCSGGGTKITMDVYPATWSWTGTR